MEVKEKKDSMASFSVSDVFSVAWSITSSRFVDCCRNIQSEVVAVNTKCGPVKGYKIPSSFDYEYINFFGIPYAKPPVGNLRFKVSDNIITSTMMLIRGEREFDFLESTTIWV